MTTSLRYYYAITREEWRGGMVLIFCDFSTRITEDELPLFGYDYNQCDIYLFVSSLIR